VHGWELADAAHACGVEPRAGDAVVIRSGHGAYYDAHADEAPGFASPSGVHASCVEFLYGIDASMLVWDWQDAPGDQQGLPNPLPISHPLHVHNVVPPYLGMPIVDNADLERLAAVCDRARTVRVPARGRAARDRGCDRIAREPSRAAVKPRAGLK
jgi:hypothetical protein